MGTIENYIDEFETLEEAQKKYPKALVLDLGEQEWDRLVGSQNTPSI